MSLPADNYILSRSASEAERLEVQHRCITSCQGYYIHPDVSLPSANARVAELATGTGIWIREVAAANPNMTFYGFDISNAMFPKQASLLPNVQFHIADIKQRFESQWLESFDMVHIRLIQAAMKVEDWAILVRNATTLLKPGGWLQWFEDDRAVAVRHASRPVAPLNTAERSLSIEKGQNQWQPPRAYQYARLNRSIMPDDRAEAMNFGYMNLDALMADPEVGNLQQVSYDGFVIDRADDGGELRRAWAVMGISAVWHMIKAWEDSGVKVADIGQEEWAEQAMKEIDAGMHYVSRAMVFVGRKRS